MSKCVIHNPDTGEILYRGSRPKEPLTPKKQGLVNDGYVIADYEGDPPSKDRAFYRLVDGRLALKSRAEIDEIELKREAAEKGERLAELKEQLAELSVVVP